MFAPPMKLLLCAAKKKTKNLQPSHFFLICSFMPGGRDTGWTDGPNLTFGDSVKQFSETHLTNTPVPGVFLSSLLFV